MSANGRLAASAGRARKPAPAATSSRNTRQRQEKRGGGMASAQHTTSRAVRLARLRDLRQGSPLGSCARRSRQVSEYNGPDSVNGIKGGRRPARD